MKLLKFLIMGITTMAVVMTVIMEALEILTATALHQAVITVEAAVMAAVTTMAVIITIITTIVAITVAAVRTTTATHQLPTLLLTLTTGSLCMALQYTTRL